MRPDRERTFSRTRPATGRPTTGPRGLVPAAYAQARRLYRQGHPDEALDRLSRLLGPDGRWTGSAAAAATLDDDTEAAPARPSRDAMREAALLRGWCLIERREHDLCLQWLEIARSRGLLLPDDTTAAVLELNIQLFGEDYALVRETVEDLLQDFTDQLDPDHAELRLLLGAALRWEGRTLEAVPHLDYACSAFQVLDEPGRAAVGANFLGWTLLSLGRLVEATRWFEKSLEINTTLEAPLRRAQNFQNLAIVHYKRGLYHESARLLHRELELVDGHPDMICRARIALGNVGRLQGDYEGARGNLLKAYSLAAETGLSREEVLSLEFLGDVFRDEGNPAEARRYYQRGMSVARTFAPEGDLVMELLRREGECLDLEGRHEEAHGTLHSALEYCRRVGDDVETAVTRRCLGVNAANLGRWHQAATEVEEALTSLRRLHADHEAMVAGYHLARLLVRQVGTGNAGAAARRLLETAWDRALAARQLNQDLGTPLLNEELSELIGDLARRRHDREETPRRAPAFSAGQAPSSRIIAVSTSMQNVLRRCDGFARYDRPVLILGESGSSKELLARRIHETSPRGARPFLKACCATSDPRSLAREIFGGSGPGEEETIGLLAHAEGGTLLLSRIHELPRPLQDRLLQVLTEQTYRPLGDSRDRQADVRIIATATVSLANLAEQGGFRPDVHFQLRLMSAIVPPLRERPEDVMPLLDHFLARLEGSSLGARNLFDFQALEALMTYSWPGGAAELESIAQQAWLQRDLGRPIVLRMTADTGRLVLESTTDKESSAGDGAKAPITNGTTTVGPGHPSGLTWISLNNLIEQADGNKARAARNLGVSRITLYRWLRQLAPDAAQDRTG